MEQDKVCSACGRHAPADAQWCPACGRYLTGPAQGSNSQTPPSSGYQGYQERATKYCSNCAASIDARAEICPKCGVRVAPAPVNYAYCPPPKTKSEGLAAVLSFLIPGLGQMYNGEIGKGVMILLGCILLGFLSFLIVPIVILVVVYIWNIYDAFKTAEELNEQAYRAMNPQYPRY